MKKSIILGIIFTFTALAMTACGNNNDPTPTPSPKPTQSATPTPEATPTDDPTPTPEATLTDTPDSGEDDSAVNASLSEIVDLIYTEKPSGLRVMTNEVDLSNADTLKAFTGLDSADKITEAVVSEAMIGSQAYSLVLVRVKDIADVNLVADAMREGINPAKWICVCADDLQVVSKEDLVCLIMVDPELADTVTSQEIVDAFNKVCK